MGLKRLWDDTTKGWWGHWGDIVESTGINGMISARFEPELYDWDLSDEDDANEWYYVPDAQIVVVWR